MNRNKLKMILAASAVLSVISAVVLLVLGIALEISVLPKVILIITSVLFVILAGEFGYFLYLNMDTKTNYFLYNPQTKRNMPLQKLTFPTISARMNRFLSGYAASEGKIWNDRVLDNPYLDMPDLFKPLVAYKLLFDLADKDVPAAWDCLAKASEDTIKFIASAIEASGDKAFADMLVKMMNDKPINVAGVRNHLITNKNYMQVKMTKYVVKNIEKF